MLGWLGIGWIALLSLLLAVRRRPPGRPWRLSEAHSRFLATLRHQLESRHPGVHWRGMVPGRFAAVLEVQGQQTPVPLHPLFRQSEAFPAAVDQLVDRLVAEIRAEGLDRIEDHEFADVANSILPQIRSLEWVRSHAPAFGGGALVHRPLCCDLAVCYVIDDAWSMLFVCQQHLRHWGRSEADLYHLATRNLLSLAGAAVPVPGQGEEPVLVSTGDGYDATRILLLDPDCVDGLLVAVPERDVLWLGRAADDQLARLMALNAEQSERSQNPVSPSLYRVRGGSLEPVRVTDTVPRP